MTDKQKLTKAFNEWLISKEYYNHVMEWIEIINNINLWTNNKD